MFLANYFSRFAQNVRWLLVVVVICAISYVVLLFMNLALVSGINEPTSIILQTQRDLLRQFNFAIPRFFDHFASWFLPLLTLPFLAKNYSFRFKFFAFLAMISLWFVIIAHSSRALILEYIVIAIVLGVLNRKWLLKFFTWQLFAVICAVVLFYNCGRRQGATGLPVGE